MKKGFSLIEVITSCVLLAILAGVIVFTYTNLRSRAQSVAQNHDQVVLQQVMESFRMMGGNISSVLALGNANDQASALTMVLQGGVSSASRKQLGQVGSLLTSNMVLVPTAATDGSARLVANPAKTALMIATTGSGFIVTSKTSTAGMAAMAPSSAAAAAANAILNAGTANGNAITGAKYADTPATGTASQYVWNEDSNVINGPSNGTTTTTTGTTVTNGGATLSVAISFDNASSGPIFNYLYHLYTFGPPPLGHITVTRSDGMPVVMADVQMSNLALGGTPLSAASPSIVQSGSALVYSFDPRRIVVGNPQATIPTASFTGTVTPSASGISDGISSTGSAALSGGLLVTANPSALNIAYSGPSGSTNYMQYATGTSHVSMSISDPTDTVVNGMLTSTPAGLTLAIGSSTPVAITPDSGTANYDTLNGSSIVLDNILSAASWTSASAANLVAKVTLPAALLTGGATYEAVGSVNGVAVSSASPTAAITLATITPSQLAIDPPSITWSSNPNPLSESAAGGWIAINAPSTFNNGQPLPSSVRNPTAWDVGIGPGYSAAPAMPSNWVSAPQYFDGNNILKVFYHD